MFTPLQNRTYRHLFLAQVVALTGTGLATVALGLLAFNLAGASAGLVLGTALTIKMVAYVIVAPVAAAFAERFNRRRFLVALDLVRAAVALCLPFVSEIWHIYILIFLLQSASAGFTPAFQATIPDVLHKEDEYTKALSLSRLAMDMESVLSPILAAGLLMSISFDNLFWGTSFGFFASAILVMSVILPSPKPTSSRGIWDRTTRGVRIYLKTPRLRGLLALNWVVSAIGSMVIVNTVVIVRGDMELSESFVAIALAGFGGGSMLSAVTIPRLLKKYDDRNLMFVGAILGIVAMAVVATIALVTSLTFYFLIASWFIVGVGFSAVLTPSGRLLARSSHPEDRPAIFAAQFTLSHVCWLIFYPLAGWLITVGGASLTMSVLTTLAIIGMIFAYHLWPNQSSNPILHSHDDLPPNHPHLSESHRHSHPIIIDDLHPKFPA